MNIIELVNATVYRGGAIALDNVNLCLPMSEHHAILGANGAGKSTLLKLITRDLHPVVKEDSVYRVFDQERLTIWDLRSKIGLVSQDFQGGYLALTTGIEVVLSGLHGSVGLHTHQKITDAQIEQAKAILCELGIEKLASKQYLQLSTGQQRRLILARSLVHKPEVLVLDEPTSGLDLQAKFWFLNCIRRLARSGTTIILVTHDPLEIIPEITKVTLLKKGQIQFSGEKQAALTEKHLSHTFNVDIRVNEEAGFFHLSPA